jgi:EmrB/QacA subfamily drug resistance transporter
VTAATPNKTASVEADRTMDVRHRNLAFATIALGMLLGALDQMIVSTALPTIVAELGGAGHMSWVVTAYLLTETIATALVGKFGDLFGRKLIYQVSCAIFVVASFFCGFAHSMTWLIVMRAVQGIGGGGMMVTSMALIADIIPLRERGRYQGAIGAVFGISTVVGPLLGGLITDDFSWRWVFYVNVPIAVVVIAVAARTLSSSRAHSRRTIDYPGILIVSLAAAGLTLGTSWGGINYPWTSPVIIGLFACSALALVAFVLVELRATEPMLPMRLFSSSVFSLSCVMTFFVAFAMLAVMIYLPTFLQFVQGVDATSSGLRTLPVVIGLLLTSTAAGNIVTRSGHYKIFPIVGGAVLAVGMFLLSRVGAQTSVLVTSLDLLVIGSGIGLCMQVLTIVVQNTVDYRDLGVATSGVSFFRSMGGAFGVSVLGAVYANQFTGRLASALAATGLTKHAVSSPAAVRLLPSVQSGPIVDAYAQSLHIVFLTGVPVAVLVTIFGLLLKQVPLRGASAPHAKEFGGGVVRPAGRSSHVLLEAIVARLMDKEAGAAMPTILVAAHTTLDAAQAWCVHKVHLRLKVLGKADLAAIAEPIGVPAVVLWPAFADTIRAGYLGSDGESIWLTPAGEREIGKLDDSLLAWLTSRLDDWNDGDRPSRQELSDALVSLARRRFVEDASPIRGPYSEPTIQTAS